LNHDGVSRAAVAVVLVDRPDGALDAAFGGDEPQASVVGEDPPVAISESRVCIASPVVGRAAIAFAAHRSRDAGHPHDPDVAEAIAPVAAEPTIAFGNCDRSADRSGHESNAARVLAECRD
jgi:hypothetical protein